MSQADTQLVNFELSFSHQKYSSDVKNFFTLEFVVITWQIHAIFVKRDYQPNNHVSENLQVIFLRFRDVNSVTQALLRNILEENALYYSDRIRKKLKKLSRSVC